MRECPGELPREKGECALSGMSSLSLKFCKKNLEKSGDVLRALQEKYPDLKNRSLGLPRRLRAVYRRALCPAKQRHCSRTERPRSVPEIRAGHAAILPPGAHPGNSCGHGSQQWDYRPLVW
ncbi:protein of unknown function [Kyrpidia spormannii]|uniref:Uncharacterized protein n=1 Tax=Kyrpidia spormannii TaxID=2055160 RepID=A0ACA8Z8H9_9BACL|nr:protein of unknown function [Kyrpidia spormannii]